MKLELPYLTDAELEKMTDEEIGRLRTIDHEAWCRAIDPNYRRTEREKREKAMNPKPVVEKAIVAPIQRESHHCMTKQERLKEHAELAKITLKIAQKRVGAPLQERLEKLEEKFTEKTADMASSTVLAQHIQRIEMLERRPSNTTLFAKQAAELAELKTNYNKQAQLLSAANKEINSLRRDIAELKSRAKLKGE